MKKRMYGLDLFRCIAALLVFMFHGKLRGLHDYGIFNNFISMGAMFMTAFFMLSGFSLYYVSNEKSNSLYKIKNFYIKRAVSIYPIYWIWMIFVIITSQDLLRNKMVIIPIKMLGLQSLWHGLYFSDEGGIWFVSCILFCYALFPFLCMMLKQLSRRQKIFFLLLFYILSFYTQIMLKITGWNGFCSNYADCIFRWFEFSVGSIWASLLKDDSIIKSELLKSWQAVALEWFVLIGIVSLGISLNIGVGDYMLYNIISIPLYCIMFYSFVGVKISEKMGRVINYFSSISYAFYLMQTFTWMIMKTVLRAYDWHLNIAIIICSIILNIVIASAVTYCISKPITRWCYKKLAVEK